MARSHPARLAVAVAIALTSNAYAALPAPQPEYHSLRRDPAKSIEQLKPETRHRELPPVMVELRAHYHPDGRTTLECEMDHGAAAGAANAVEEPQS